jgi:hypothetical protein
MTLQDLKQQVMELPIADRQQLVESLLASIQQETQVGHPAAEAVTIAQTEADIKEHLANLPLADAWLEDNLAAKASLERGLQQASQSEGRFIGSFARQLHPWTESLIGVIKDDGKDEKETDIDDLESKYLSGRSPL